MADPMGFLIEGEAAQALNRIVAQTGRTPAEAITFALSSVDKFLSMAPGQKVVVTKRVSDSDLFVSDILDGTSGDSDGGRSPGDSGQH